MMIERLLKPTFAAAHVTALAKHYHAMMIEFQQGAWEQAIGKAGKFDEAVLKALWVHTGKTVPAGRAFKAGAMIDGLPNAGAFDDSVKLTIPRAIRFTYDIASNRGARHDSEIDPNEMDAQVVVNVASWILAEMIRYAQKAVVDPAEVKALIDGLVEKKYPIFEEVDGRPYAHVSGASAREIALLLLWKRHPKRMRRDELLQAVMRHKFTKGNADTGVTRLKGVVDVGSDGLRLLQPGVQEGDQLYAKAQGTGVIRKARRRRLRPRRSLGTAPSGTTAF